MTEVYLTRHLERVDDDDSQTWEGRQTYKFNPYLNNTISSVKLLGNLPNTIETIISSPFIRCVQTAIIVAKNKNINVIFIDYRLGETNDVEWIFDGNAYKPNDIWIETQKYILSIQKQPNLSYDITNITFNITGTEYEGGEDEVPNGDETLYNIRMRDALFDITQKNTNTLIVSHSNSLRFSKPGKSLAYAEVVQITSDMFIPKGAMGFAAAAQSGGASNIYIQNKNRYVSLLHS